MNMENLVYILLVMFVASAAIGYISVEMAGNYNQDISNSFMGDVNNISGLQDDLINPMSSKLEEESSVSLVTVGTGIVGAAKLLFNIPTYFIALVLSLGNYAPIPSLASTLINAVVWVTVVFGFLYFIFGRRL